jgi:outer membrane protein, adhesin transport system
MRVSLKQDYKFHYLKLLWIVISFLLFFSSHGVAQLYKSAYLNEKSFPEENTNITIVTLKEVLQSVANTNPEIKEAISNYESIKAEKSIAKQGYRPTIGTEIVAGREYTDGTPTGYKEETYTSKTATVYARQNLYKGGETIAFNKETDARIKAAAYNALNVANEVFSKTTEAYINVLQAREQLKISEYNVLTQARILKQIKEKIDSGFGRISDLTNSESRLSLAKGNYISHQQTLNQAVTKFHKRYGRFLQPEAFITPDQKYETPETVESTVSIAFDNHPAIDVAKYNILAKRYAYKKAKAAYLPSLDLELKAQREEDTGGVEGDTDQASAMLILKYDFYDGGIRKGESNKSYKALLKEYQRLYIERRNLNEAVRLAWNILEAEDKKREFLAEHVALSKKTLAEFVEEYHLGRRTLLEILDMEKEHYNANSAYISSKYSFIIAYYQTSKAMGLMLHEFDTKILDKINLSHIKDDFDMSAYDGLEMDADQDTISDFIDQCDNSALGTPEGSFGCSTSKYSTIGYENPEEIAPYINTLEESLTPPKPELKKQTPEKKEKPILKIDKTKKEQTFTFNNIYFKTNSSYLKPGSIPLIKKIAAQLKTLENYSLEVTGHTDHVGSDKYNLWLSKKRANRVVKFLLKQGVKLSNIKATGAGERFPVATNSTPEGREQNRRTQFKLTKE